MRAGPRLGFVPLPMKRTCLSSRLACTLLLIMPLGCNQCQDPGTFNRTFSLITPVQELVDFGDVYLSTDKTRQVAVRSEGNGVVHVSSVRVEGSPYFEVRGNTDVVIQPGVEQSWNVVFTPLEVADADATVIIANNSENRSELRIRIHGRGVNFPSCDDQNPCTRDHFDPLLLECVHVASLNGCDDGSACTTGDTCVGGRCLGAAVTCVDPDPCTRDLCEATSGCVFITDIAACDDDEPCTAETCDPVTGCGHAPLPDGLPCALGNNSCLAALQCQSGQCVGTPLPDGAPCTDFLACTVDDRCTNGICSGTLPPDTQVSAATYSFASSYASTMVGLGQFLVTAETNTQFLQHGGDSVLLTMDVTQRPVKARHAARIPDEVVVELAAAAPYVLALSVRHGDPTASVMLHAYRMEANGALVAEMSSPTGAEGISWQQVMTVLGDNAWECTTGVLTRWHLPDMTATSSAVPCKMVDADPSQQKLWILADADADPWRLHRLSTASFPPAVELSTPVSSYSMGLRVLDGVGLLYADRGNGVKLLSLDGVLLDGSFSSSTSAVSVAPGRALILTAGGYFSVQVAGAMLDSISVYPGPQKTVFHAACAQGACLFVGAAPPHMLDSASHGTPLTPVDALGMGGFTRVLDVGGDVVAASQYGAHKLELVGGSLEVTESVNFSSAASLISWQVDGLAPVVGDLAPVSAGVSVLANDWRGSPMVDGRFNGTRGVLATLGAAALGSVARHGKFVYEATIASRATNDEHVVTARSYDTSQWTAGAPLMVGAVETASTPAFQEQRAHAGALVRITRDGQHLLAVAPFFVPGADNAVRLFAYNVSGTSLALDWSARISTPGRTVYDAAYAHPDVLIISGEDEAYGASLEHYRYQGMPGSIAFKGTTPAGSGHYHALLHYDEGIAMVGNEAGILLYQVGETAPVLQAELATLEPVTDVQILDDRLWVTGRHVAEVFFPPCPPDVLPP